MTFLQSIVEHISAWPLPIKLIVLSLSVVIEYIFPIFPGDTAVILAGFLEAKGIFDLKEIFFCIIIGSLIGCYLTYQAGVYLANSKKFGLVQKIKSSKAFHEFNLFYSRFGPWLLIFNRFFHGIRPILFVSAGLVRLPLGRVLILGLLGAVIYNLFLVLLGYFIGFNAELIIKYLYKYSFVFYILVLILILLILIYFWRKKHKK
jgi:membrane protein DedA with SNARE-associated domain